MAKVTGPLLSLDASGTIAKTATYSKWKGINYCRLRVIPLNPQSSDQQDARIRTGSVGKSMAQVVRLLVVDPVFGFYTDALGLAPAGQSWISYAMKTILGANFSTWDDNNVDYTALTPTKKALYTTAANNLGLTDLTFAVVGAIASVTKGEQLYHMLFFAINSMSYVLTAGTLSAPDAGGLGDFVDYVKATGS